MMRAIYIRDRSSPRRCLATGMLACAHRAIALHFLTACRLRLSHISIREACQRGKTGQRQQQSRRDYGAQLTHLNILYESPVESAVPG